MRKVDTNQVSVSGRGPKEKWPFKQWLEEIKQLKDNEWLLLEPSDLPSKTKYPSSYIRHMYRTKYSILVETKVTKEGILLRLEKLSRKPTYVTANTQPTQPETDNDTIVLEPLTQDS